MKLSTDSDQLWEGKTSSMLVPMTKFHALQKMLSLLFQMSPAIHLRVSHSISNKHPVIVESLGESGFLSIILCANVAGTIVYSLSSDLNRMTEKSTNNAGSRSESQLIVRTEKGAIIQIISTGRYTVHASGL